jgi:hypothetical protein
MTLLPRTCRESLTFAVNRRAVGDGCTLSCILAAGARVPFLYLAHAFLAFLTICALRGMNNLRVCNGLDSSIPTAPTKSPVESVAPTTRGTRFGA